MKLVVCFFIALLATQFCRATQDVKFKSGDIELAGTLYIPNGTGPFPAVVFVHGSGAETRDNSRYSARWLQSLGYVALTYDKRGTGDSGGDPNSVERFSFEDLAKDVVAAVAYLSGQPQVDKTKIGLHATSQGGWVAALSSHKSEYISFMIVKSASVCTVAEDRIYERSTRLANEGFTRDDIEEAKAMQRAEPATSPAPDDEFSTLFDQFRGRPWFKRVYLGEDSNSPGLVAFRTWYATVADFDPVHYLAQMDIPVFWIFGEPRLDHSGPVELSLANLRRIGSQVYEIVQIDGEGHQVREKTYELQLYNWLCEINDYRNYKFKKH